MNVTTNRYIGLWLPIIGLHALHQIEEGIGFFQWYADNAHRIPDLLRIVGMANATRAVLHPEYFIVASIAQILSVSLIAYLFRRNEQVTRILVFLYLSGLAFFLVWHITTSYLAHSYAPVMVTCLGGMYLIPLWMYKLSNSGKPESSS